MKQRFSDYFRCPDDFVDFRLSAELAPRAGFCRFGPDLMCYVRTISGRTQPDPSGSLEDVFSQTRTKQRTVYLPFSIDEVMEHLRRKPYSTPSLAHNTGSAAQSVACKIYYIVRPFLPTFIGQHIQRLALHHWDERPFPSWPIDHTVDRLFESAMAFAIRATFGE